MTLPLSPGDKVVSCTSYRDYLIVVTERGEVFTLMLDDYNRMMVVAI